MRVRDVMTQDVATVAPDTDLRDVAVEKGVVTLSGKVGNKAQARQAEAFVDRVPGVVGITSRLHWEDGR